MGEAWKSGQISRAPAKLAPESHPKEPSLQELENVLAAYEKNLSGVQQQLKRYNEFWGNALEQLTSQTGGLEKCRIELAAAKEQFGKIKVGLFSSRKTKDAKRKAEKRVKSAEIAVKKAESEVRATKTLIEDYEKEISSRDTWVIENKQQTQKAREAVDAKKASL